MERHAPWWVGSAGLRALIALAVVPGGLVLLAAAWLVRGPESADGLARFLQAVMLTVIGFYFGGLGTERAERRAASAQHEAEALREVSVSATEATDATERRLARTLAILDRLAEDPATRRKIDALLDEVDE